MVDSLYHGNGFVQVINEKFDIITTYENSNITHNCMVKMNGYEFHGDVNV